MPRGLYNRFKTPAFERALRHRIIDEQTGCWIWTGSKNDRGYGQINDGGKTRLVTHVSLETVTAKPANKPHALHSCDNPTCFNPLHLRWGTPAENSADKMHRRRHPGQTQTHCHLGHEFSDENTRVKGGQRICKICERRRTAAYSQRKRVARIAAGWKPGKPGRKPKQIPNGADERRVSTPHNSTEE